MSEAQWRLSHSPRSARRARDLLRIQLLEWKIDAQVAFTAELLLSELVTNALLHARMPAGREIGVRVARYNERLRVEVADANNSRPQLRTAIDTDEHGRGLALIDALAQRWGCCPRRHGIGKAIWAELPLEGRTPEEVALDHIARGLPLSSPSSLGDDSEAMAVLRNAMFDGPADLATQS
ncbi:ATP-binding protein [Streptomyces sp. 3214.6]|uniref:ATP-binding protein n=1 Tax=Streptomyces sp. 3214.6 TaxID=1882757 RepID=UPI00156FA9E0|nr:ATP-binding protein [Streptomyces sp. 3214.6]